MASIEDKAFTTLQSVSNERQNIMDQVAAVAVDPSRKVTINTGGDIPVKTVDISTGAGALVLDDKLQELATLEQSAAQLVAAENRAQKDVQARMA